MYLFLFLFDSDSFKEKDKMREKVKEVTQDRNLKFLEWCLDGNVSYFPRDEIAIKNIHLNNRVIMKNNDHLLIRGLPRIFEDYDENLPEIEQWYDDNEYKFIPYKLTSKLLNLENKLDEMDYFDAIEFIVKLEKESASNNGYINVFEKGTFSGVNNKIYHKYSKYDSSLVLEDNRVIKNDKISFIKELFETFIKSNIKQKTYSLNYVYHNSHFFSDFIPKPIDSINKKFEFIKILIKNIKYFTNHGLDTLYGIEMAKVNTIYEYLKNVEGKSSDATSIKKIRSNKYNNKLKTLHYYNSLYYSECNFEKYLLYSKVEMDERNLESVVKSLIDSVKDNIEMDEISFIEDFFKKEIQKISKMSNYPTLSLFEQVSVEEHLTDKSKIKINSNEYCIEEISFYEFGTNELNKQLTSKDLFRLNDYYHIYFSNNFIITLPNTLSKMIEIIKNKNGQFDKRNFSSEISIVNTPNYDEAVTIIKIQNDVSRAEAEFRLNSFLKDKDPKYYESILKVLSSYKVFEEDEMEIFKSKILDLINDHHATYVIPLKAKTDENGLHQILYHKYQDLFDRNTDTEKRLSEDYKKLSNQIDVDQFVILSDLGISGAQFKRTISSYLGINDESISKGLVIENKIVFKSNLLNSKHIIILNCVYTRYYENIVRQYFHEELQYEGEIEFFGKKINHEDYLFSNQTPRVKELFLEFIKRYYKNEDFNFIWSKGYFKYLEKSEEDHPRNSLIARYKSLPKLHHCVFSKNSLLKYRKD